MRERIGILTGGGDCPGLNTVIRAVVKCASKRGWDTIGFLDGFEGLLEPLRFWIDAEVAIRILHRENLRDEFIHALLGC